MALCQCMSMAILGEMSIQNGHHVRCPVNELKLERTPDIVLMKFGSHLYGLDTPESDIDYKGIFMPSLRELLLGNYPKTIKFSTGDPKAKNEAGDLDVELISLPYFIKLACKGETMAIDMLHCHNPLMTSKIWLDLVARRKEFYTKKLHAFTGYVRRQAAKYGLKGSRVADLKLAIEYFEGIEYGEEKQVGDKGVWDNLPTSKYLKKVHSPKESPSDHEQWFYEVLDKRYQSKMRVDQILKLLNVAYDKTGARARKAADNEGVDWKAVSHAIRASCQARDIFLKGDFDYPLAETDIIKKIKLGQVDYETEAEPLLENAVSLVEDLSKASDLPESVDVNKWDEWLITQYRTAYGIQHEPNQDLPVLHGAGFD